MTTPLFLLRCLQIGLSMRDLDLLTVGMVNDIFVENMNDDWCDNKKGETNRMNNIDIQFKGWGEDKIKYTDSEKR